MLSFSSHTVIVFLTLLSVSLALVRCNGNATKLQLCSLVTDYDKGTSNWKYTGKPMKVWSSVTVIKIAELDEDKNTITLNILLSTWWYDTRVTIESSHPNE